MIRDKKELRRYLEQDRLALRIGQKKRPQIFGDEIWKFTIALRKWEYYSARGGVWRVPALYYRFRTHNLGLKCGGFTVPRGVFGPGLSIAHPGSVTVNHTARVGRTAASTKGCASGPPAAARRPPLSGTMFLSAAARKSSAPSRSPAMWPSARGRWWSAPSPSPAPPGRASRRGRSPTGTPTGI